MEVGWEYGRERAERWNGKEAYFVVWPDSFSDTVLVGYHTVDSCRGRLV